MNHPLTGPAAVLLRSLSAKAERLRDKPSPLKLLFVGPPGVGKSECAKAIARHLAGHELGVEIFPGPDVTADTVRDWRKNWATGSLFGDWRCLVIEEADKMSPQAQVLMLTFLDLLPPARAVICTSNEETTGFEQRFQSRFQLWPVRPPSVHEIVELLVNHYRLLPNEAAQIAARCGGNVRAATLDAEALKDWQAA